MEVGDGRVDFLRHLVFVPSFEFLDGLVDLANGIVFVTGLVSLVGFGETVLGGLQQWHRVAGFLGGLEIFEGFALLGQIGEDHVGGAQQEHDKGNLQQEAETLFHGDAVG